MGRIAHLFSGQVTGTVTDVAASTPHDISNAVIVNTTAALAYLQVFWKASGSVTLGTTVPDAVIPLPANGGVAIHFEDEGWHTNSQMSIAGTTTRGGLTGAALDVTLWRKL